MDDSRDISSQNPHSLRKVKKRFVKSYTKSTKSFRICLNFTIKAKICFIMILYSWQFMFILNAKNMRAPTDDKSGHL